MDVPTDVSPGSVLTLYPLHLQGTHDLGAKLVLEKSFLEIYWAGPGPTQFCVCLWLPSHPFKDIFTALLPGLLFNALVAGKKLLCGWAERKALPLPPHQLQSFFRFSHISPLRSLKLSSSLHFSVSGLLLISWEDVPRVISDSGP